MQHNILRDTEVTKIYLVYLDSNSVKRKESVKLRFMDNKECYFAGVMPVNFVKPKKKTSAELIVYTEDGVYKSNVVIKESNLSLRDIIYTVSIPQKWDFIQYRNSSRKKVQLPLVIKFKDDFIITAQTEDLSLGGISFFSNQNVSSIYKKISGILTLEFPQDLIINFPDSRLVVETKFVREKLNVENHYGEVLYVYKFLSLNSDEQMILKNFLMKLN